MEAQIIIKPLNNQYCDQVINLILPIQQIEFNVPVTLGGQPDLLDIERYYNQQGGCFWAAFRGDELIGTIALMNVGHQTGVIRKMFVKKEYRGGEFGIAGQLLQILLKYSKAHGITDIYLGTVDMLKAAHRFYEKNEFKEIGEQALPVYFPRMPADNKFYHLVLDIETANP